MELEPYDRIMNAVRHKLPDRPAIDYIATPEANLKFKQYLKIEDDEILRQRLGVDLRIVSARYVGPKHLCGAAGVEASGKDFWGVVWKPIQYELGVYNEIEVSPLANATTVKEIEDYNWPDLDWFDVSHIKNEINQINSEHRYAIKFFAGGAFESPWYMRGMERFLLDLIDCPDIAEAICTHVAGFYKERALRAIEASDGQIDIIGSGGDIGSQRGLMLSPDLWREHIKPYSRQLIQTFKDMGLTTYYHSCGSIFPVIEDFIEMGLDILNPIQPEAVDMDAVTLQKHFGDRLCFHGGIDEQDLLPNGTADDVSKEVERIINVLGADGGYIVCPAHAFQPDTPAENMMAIYDTAQAYSYSS